MSLFCVLNQTRNSFLALRVRKTQSVFIRLPGWSGRKCLEPCDGIWLISRSGIYTIGRTSAMDVIYLDNQGRVIRLVEHLKPFPISILAPPCRDVLELPARTIYGSHTEIGDQLLICAPEDLESKVRHGAPVA